MSHILKNMNHIKKPSSILSEKKLKSLKSICIHSIHILYIVLQWIETVIHVYNSQNCKRIINQPLVSRSNIKN